jgi:hypothetical protein
MGEGAAPFRLADSQTTLFEKPDAASTVLEQLPSGALITVMGREGDFLRVLTSDDKLGYISGSVSMGPAEVPIGAIPAVPLTEPISDQERVERLSRVVSSRSLEGWIVVDKNDRDASAVLRKPGKEVNHILHFLIAVFTCGLWAIVWLILTLNREKEQRMRVSIDGYGNLLEETIALS